MNTCCPDMTLRLTAFPCLAASMSLGIGKGVLKCAELPIPRCAQISALDAANAPQPRAKFRRVRGMGRLELAAIYGSELMAGHGIKSFDRIDASRTVHQTVREPSLWQNGGPRAPFSSPDRDAERVGQPLVIWTLGSPCAGEHAAADKACRD